MSMNSRKGRLVVGIGAVVWCVLAVAQTGAPPLTDIADLLPRLQPEMRERLQQRAAIWQGWSDSQRQEFRHRLQQWDELPPADREARRERYRAWQALPAADRTQVETAAERYRHLPAERQQALREQFDALDGSERRGWLLGPALGADYPALQPLLAQVPAAEHSPLLAVLRAMTPSQRGDLAVLVQRTPPQDRATLRVELAALATPDTADPDRIRQWLWERLDR